MSTPRITHQKIQEISSKYISGRVPINVHSIADELGINKDIVAEHISVLKTLDLIDYTDHSNEVIILTDSGKLASL